MNQEMIQPFIESSINALMKMAEIKIQNYETATQNSTQIFINDFASIVGFSGKIEGWVMINMSKELANRVALYIVGEDELIDDEIMSQTVCETCNVIVGNANTIINNKYSFRLKCAPPILFFGAGSKLTLPQINSYSINFNTEFGILRLIISFDAKMFF